MTNQSTPLTTRSDLAWASAAFGPFLLIGFIPVAAITAAVLLNWLGGP